MTASASASGSMSRSRNFIVEVPPVQELKRRVAAMCLTGALVCGAHAGAAAAFEGSMVMSDPVPGVVFDVDGAAPAPVTSSATLRQDLRGQDLSYVDVRASLVRALLEKTSFVMSDLTGIFLTHCSAIEADFSGANLSQAAMDGADLSRANFQQAIFKQTLLVGAKMDRADITGADFSDAIMSKALQKKLCERADGTNLSTGVDTRASLGCDQLAKRASAASGPAASGTEPGSSAPSSSPAPSPALTLPGAASGEIAEVRQGDTPGATPRSRIGALLADVNFGQLDRPESLANPGPDYSGLDLRGSSFVGANLKRADFHKSDLSRTALTRVRAQEANFSDAVLVEASLDDANLARANMNNAILRKALFFGAVFDDADVTNADFTDAFIPREIRKKLCERAQGVNEYTNVSTRVSLGCKDTRESVSSSGGGVVGFADAP